MNYLNQKYLKGDTLSAPQDSSALIFGQNRVSGVQFVLQGSLWDQVETSLFQNPHLGLSSSPGLSFLIPYRFLPIKYLHNSSISGSDFTEWDYNYSFNQKLRTELGGRPISYLSQSV